MKMDRENQWPGFERGPQRYASPARRESPARGGYGLAKPSIKDRYVLALDNISAEDQDPRALEDSGPVVFKDGVFQIDIRNEEGKVAIDPALKGLIDSILGS
jgi:hypothetical protein